MVILTIRFPNGTKEYDYLMKNDKQLTLDGAIPVKFVTGVGYHGLEFKLAYCVRRKLVYKLPPHVTTFLSIHEDNFVCSVPISAEELQNIKR